MGEHMNILRSMCPVTCGCHLPTSGLVVRSGCPNSCSVQATYIQAMSQTPTPQCQDTTLDLLQGLSYWNDIVTGFNDLLPEYSLAQKGCSLVMEFPEIFCTDGKSFLSLALLCPESCRCHEV